MSGATLLIEIIWKAIDANPGITRDDLFAEIEHETPPRWANRRYQDGGRGCSALQGGGEGPRWEGRQGPSSALNRAVLLLDVLTQDTQRCPAH
jgi:hypothetical protein